MPSIVPYKNRELVATEPILVYRCLNKKGIWYSIKQNGQVVAHTTSITLTNVEFIVKLGGQKEVKRTNQKNVHAFVKGIMTEDACSTNLMVTYNPYENNSFMCRSMNQSYPIFQAQTASINERGLFVISSERFGGSDK